MGRGPAPTKAEGRLFEPMIDRYYTRRIARRLGFRRGELPLRAVFAPTLRAIYFYNPKVAGTTIINALVRADSPDIAASHQRLSAQAARLAIGRAGSRA